MPGNNLEMDEAPGDSLSLWDQRSMLRLARILDGVVAEFIVRGDRQADQDKWRQQVGGILLLLASVLKDADTHSIDAIAAQSGQVAFRRMREKGLDPLNRDAVRLHMEREARLQDSREILLQMDRTWTQAQQARPKAKPNGKHKKHPKKKKRLPNGPRPKSQEVPDGAVEPVAEGAEPATP